MRSQLRTAAIVLFVILSFHKPVHAGKKSKFTITYISGATVYIDGGRVQRVVIGDTASVFHSGSLAATGLIAATADSSSAINIISQSAAYSVGDTVIATTETNDERSLSPDQEPLQLNVNASSTFTQTKSDRENILSGRAALQYYFVSAEDAKFNLRQPGGMLAFNVSNLMGTGMLLSFDERSYYDGTNNYSLFGNASGFQHNLYEFSISRDLPGASIGYSAGRMNSRFVGGLGTVDGAQFYYRTGDFIAGFLGGAAANVPSSLNFGGTKSAFFLNYHSGTDFLRRYDGTIAYGLEMVDGKLDRNFLYLQNSLAAGMGLSFYETSEIDLSRFSNGARMTSIDFSNTFFSANYSPLDWLFASLGYDASRDVYLFQTMKNIPDSLIDRNILQGYRASVTAHLPGMVTLSVNGTLNARKDFARDEHTLGGSVRIGDLLGTGADAGARYTGMVGVFSNGHDFSADLEYTFLERLTLTFHYDSYFISVATLQQEFSTSTYSGILDYDFSARLYSALEIDDFVDPTMNSINASFELGIRF